MCVTVVAGTTGGQCSRADGQSVNWAHSNLCTFVAGTRVHSLSDSEWATRADGCGQGWLSGAYTLGTLSYGEEEFNSNSACST
jgi:hypothetical protein